MDKVEFYDPEIGDISDDEGRSNGLYCTMPFFDFHCNKKRSSKRWCSHMWNHIVRQGDFDLNIRCWFCGEPFTNPDGVRLSDLNPETCALTDGLKHIRGHLIANAKPFEQSQYDASSILEFARTLYQRSVITDAQYTAAEKYWSGALQEFQRSQGSQGPQAPQAPQIPYDSYVPQESNGPSGTNGYIGNDSGSYYVQPYSTSAPYDPGYNEEPSYNGFSDAGLSQSNAEENGYPVNQVPRSNRRTVARRAPPTHVVRYRS